MSTTRRTLSERIKSSRLRQVVRSSRAHAWLKLWFKRLTGRELLIVRQRRLGTTTVGGWQYADFLGPDSVVYSFGIGDSVEFELCLIERFGLTVHAFDPTPYTLVWIEQQQLPPTLHFHPWAVAGTDGSLKLFPRARPKGRRSESMWTLDPAQGDGARCVEVPAYSVPTIKKLLGHGRVDLIKLDVEGAEYGAIESLLAGAAAELSYPTQLLVEFHHRFPGIGKAKTSDCLARLRAAGYEVFAVSRTGREVGLVREERGAHASAHGRPSSLASGA